MKKLIICIIFIIPTICLSKDHLLRIEDFYYCYNGLLDSMISEFHKFDINEFMIAYIYYKPDEVKDFNNIIKTKNEFYTCCFIANYYDSILLRFIIDDYIYKPIFVKDNFFIYKHLQETGYLWSEVKGINFICPQIGSAGGNFALIYINEKKDFFFEYKYGLEKGHENVYRDKKDRLLYRKELTELIYPTLKKILPLLEFERMNTIKDKTYD